MQLPSSKVNLIEVVKTCLAMQVRLVCSSLPLQQFSAVFTIQQALSSQHVYRQSKTSAIGIHAFVHLNAPYVEIREV